MYCKWKITDIRSKFAGLSFDESKSASNFIESFNSRAATLKEEINKIVPKEFQEEIFQKSLKKLEDRATAVLVIYGRKMSSAYTGGGNFPASKQKKIHDRAHVLEGEYFNFNKKELEYINKKYNRREKTSLDEIEESFIYLHNQKSKNTTMKSTLESKIYTQVKYGNYEQMKELLQKYDVWTSKHSIHQTIERVQGRYLDKKEATEVAREGRELKVYTAGGALNISFPDKPIAKIRTYMKLKGFRWNGKDGIWCKVCAGAGLKEEIEEYLGKFYGVSEAIQEEEQEQEGQIEASMETMVVDVIHEADQEKFIHLNHITRKEYSGNNINALEIKKRSVNYKENEWLTFLQAKSLGLSIKKGASSVKLTSIFIVEKEKNDESVIENKREVKYFNVFNVEETEKREKIAGAGEDESKN